MIRWRQDLIEDRDRSAALHAVACEVAAARGAELAALRGGIERKGRDTLTIGGEERIWLEDGDEISFGARAERAGHATIGFGACRGALAPCPAWPDPR